MSFAAWPLPEKLLTKIPFFKCCKATDWKTGQPIEFANLFPVNKVQGLLPRPAVSSHLLRRKKAGWLAYLFISLFYKGVTNWADFLDLVPTLFLIRECDFYNPQWKPLLYQSNHSCCLLPGVGSQKPEQEWSIWRWFLKAEGLLISGSWILGLALHELVESCVHSFIHSFISPI